LGFAALTANLRAPRKRGVADIADIGMLSLMTAHAFPTLDPVDPKVRAQARQLAVRLAKDPGKDTQVSRVVRAMLSDIAQGGHVVVLRANEEVTPARAAQILGVTRQFVDRLLANGALAFHRLPGSTHRRIAVGDVLALAAEREQRQAGHMALREAFADVGLLDKA
jgi:excisionase family DNA binding protein